MMDMPDYSPLYLLDRAYDAIEQYANTGDSFWMDGAESCIKLALTIALETYGSGDGYA